MKIKLFTGFLISIFFTFSNLLFAQDTSPAWDHFTFATQPSPYLNIQLGRHHGSILGNQAYVATVTNVSQSNIEVTGSVVAYLICGNQVSSQFDVTLKPGETEGGGSAVLLNDEGLGGNAITTDCEGTKIYPDPTNQPTLYYINRIKSVGIINLNVVLIKDQNADNNAGTTNQTTASNNTINNSPSSTPANNYNNPSTKIPGEQAKAEVQQTTNNVTNQIRNGDTQTTGQDATQLASAIGNLIGAISNNHHQNSSSQPVAKDNNVNNYSPPPSYTPPSANNNGYIDPPAANALINAKAPDINFAETNGSVFKLSDYAGKKVLLIFWGSYDDNSITQFSIVKSYYSSLIQKHITVIGIAEEFSRYQWQAAIKDNILPGLQLSELNGTGNDTYENYKITKLPILFYINPSGNIIQVSDTFSGIKPYIK
jgi:peroxiredoxin